jgi:hypothetical protein
MVTLDQVSAVRARHLTPATSAHGVKQGINIVSFLRINPEFVSRISYICPQQVT